MTLCHDVTKPDLPISACRWARKLFLFLFPWFFRSPSSKMLLVFYFCDDVMSWRHVMPSQNLIYLSQLVDVQESWFFFCFHGFLGHWVHKCYWFSICMMTYKWWRYVIKLLVSHLYNAVTSWRYVMTSQNLIYLSQLVDELESWFFFVSMVF